MQNDHADADLHNSLAALTAAEQYLRQQQGLYGNIIYRSSVHEKADEAVYTPPIHGNIDPSLLVHEPPAPKTAARTADTSVMRPEPDAAAAPHAPAAPHAAFADPVTRPAVMQQAAREPWQDAVSLAELHASICTCMKCPLGASRTKFVFGVGNPASGVMVIGEAPGADEDAHGEPFVGKAGQLLNKILEAVKFARQDVFIANILKCRPPGNRRPAPVEVELCEPYLWKQIELVKPKIILCLGLTAAQTLLKSTSTLGALRGSVQRYRGIPLIVTYHPAALLRNPNWKRPTWEDVQQFRKMYDDIIAAG